MGYLEDVERNAIKDRAIKVLKKCGDRQIAEPDNDSIATIAKIWFDIYNGTLKKEEKHES